MGAVWPVKRTAKAGTWTSPLLSQLSSVPGTYKPSHLATPTASPGPQGGVPYVPSPEHSSHLQVSLLVVVDANKGVARLCRQVRHQARLAAAGGALQ